MSSSSLALHIQVLLFVEWMPSAEIQNWHFFKYWMLTTVSIGKYTLIVYYSKSEAEKRPEFIKGCDWQSTAEKTNESDKLQSYYVGGWVTKQLKILSMFILNSGKVMFHW